MNTFFAFKVMLSIYLQEFAIVIPVKTVLYVNRMVKVATLVNVVLQCSLVLTVISKVCHYILDVCLRARQYPKPDTQGRSTKNLSLYEFTSEWK